MDALELLPEVRPTVELFVLGRPQTAGSKTAIPGKGPGGRPLIVESGNRAAKRSWRGDCRDAAAAALGDDPAWPAEGACAVDVVFCFVRPKSHYRTGRNERTLRDGAPADHVQDPDATKVWRAAEDALTGVLWRDDNRIVRQTVAKTWVDRFTGREGMRLRVEQL